MKALLCKLKGGHSWLIDILEPLNPDNAWALQQRCSRCGSIGATKELPNGVLLASDG